MKVCLLVVLVSLVLAVSCDVCTGDNCEGGLAEFGPPDRDTIVNLEKNPGATAPLPAAWEKPGPAVPNMPVSVFVVSRLIVSYFHRGNQGKCLLLDRRMLLFTFICSLTSRFVVLTRVEYN
mgnify:CR=1 FL=1